MKKSAQGVPVKPPCRKPKKIPEGAIVVGPFVLEKGRGERWSLKGVKGVTFRVSRPPGATDYFADLDFLDGPPSMVVYGVTPEGAAEQALRLVRKRMAEVVKVDRGYMREAQRTLASSERISEILRTGKPPQVDRVKPARRKR